MMLLECERRADRSMFHPPYSLRCENDIRCEHRFKDGNKAVMDHGYYEFRTNETEIRRLRVVMLLLQNAGIFADEQTSVKPELVSH